MKYLFLLDFDKTIIDFDSFTRLVLLCSKTYQKIIFVLLSILHKLKVIDNSKFKLLVNLRVFDLLDERNKPVISHAITKMTKGQAKLNFFDQLPLNSEIIIVSATYGFIVREFISHYKLPRVHIQVLGDDLDFFPGYLKGCAVKEFIFKNNKMLSNYSSVISFSDSLADITLLSVSNVFYLVKRGEIISALKSRR